MVPAAVADQLNYIGQFGIIPGCFTMANKSRGPSALCTCPLLELLNMGRAKRHEMTEWVTGIAHLH